MTVAAAVLVVATETVAAREDSNGGGIDDLNASPVQRRLTMYRVAQIIIHSSELC